MSKQTKEETSLPKVDIDDFIHNPDDAVAKYFLSYIVVAEEMIRYVLPPSMLALLDFSTLKHDKDSYVGDNLKSRYADISYQIKLKDSNLWAGIRFIKEPKSIKPKKGKAISPQMLLYAAFSMDYDQRLNKPMLLPIPILIYHGSKTWKGENLADFFKGMPLEFAHMVPEAKFYTVNANEIDDVALIGMNFNFLGNFLFALKYGRSKKGLLQNFDKIFIFAEGDSFLEVTEKFFETLFIYVNQITSLNNEEMEELLKTLPPVRRSKAKTLYEQTLEKGEKRATLKKDRDFSRKLLKRFPELSDKEIASLVGTSAAFVKRMRKELKAEASN